MGRKKRNNDEMLEIALRGTSESVAGTGISRVQLIYNDGTVCVIRHPGSSLGGVFREYLPAFTNAYSIRKAKTMKGEAVWVADRVKDLDLDGRLTLAKLTDAVRARGLDTAAIVWPGVLHSRSAKYYGERAKELAAKKAKEKAAADAVAAREARGLMLIRVAVAAGYLGDGPGIVFYRVECSRYQYEQGEHYEAARREAKNAGGEPPFVAIDENDMAWLFRTPHGNGGKLLRIAGE